MYELFATYEDSASAFEAIKELEEGVTWTKKNLRKNKTKGFQYSHKCSQCNKWMYIQLHSISQQSSIFIEKKERHHVICESFLVGGDKGNRFPEVTLQTMII